MIIYTKKISDEESTGISVYEEVALTFDDRKRGRLKFSTTANIEAGFQIERGQVLRHGSFLISENGQALKVCAKQEQVSSAYIDNAVLFARACYHLGNRHVPLQVGEGFLRFQEDYVLDDMLHGLGIHVKHEQAVFEPENGAYSKGGHSHSHEHGHSHDHSHEHSHE